MSRIRFTNRHGIRLTGTLDRPRTDPPVATALFAHCFTCNRNFKAAHNISRALAAHGFAVLRFDFTGLGESEGDFADTSFSSNLDDLEDAAAWLTEQVAAPRLLVGHSLGGTAVLAVAPRIASVRAVATVAAPSTPEHVLRHFDDQLERIERDGEAEVTLSGRTFKVRRDFIEDARGTDLQARLSQLDRALLVLHSPDDRVVNIEHAERIFMAGSHPKSFVSLAGADHLLSDQAHSRYAGEVIAAWARPHVGDAAKGIAAKSADAKRQEHDEVTVFGRTDQGFTCTVHAGTHELTADEPTVKGGADEGPDPYAFLAVALGSCTVMTLNMYARHKKLPVSEVNCHVTHRKIHAEDCADCETREGKVDEFERRIAISGDIDAAQRERMLEIANRCPVHRTLSSEIRIRSSLID